MVDFPLVPSVLMDVINDVCGLDFFDPPVIVDTLADDLTVLPCVVSPVGWEDENDVRNVLLLDKPVVVIVDSPLRLILLPYVGATDVGVLFLIVVRIVLKKEVVDIGMRLVPLVLPEIFLEEAET